ncbi:MAG: hypothetical protein ACI8VW_000201 [bacterium]
MSTPLPAIIGVCLLAIMAIQSAGTSSAETSITVADASLGAAFYPDGSCLLTVDVLVQSGKTIIDADVDDVGSRMLIHCDTKEGRRLTLLARGDALNVSQRVPLLTREQIQEGKFGMIAWLTRSGVHYADDSAPRRYVIAGSVILRKSPPVAAAGFALHAQRRPFAQVNGVLEPIVKSDSLIQQKPAPLENLVEPTEGSGSTSD